MKPKIIVFDIDGTLTVSKQPLTSEMGAALQNLLVKMPVGIMSGGDLPQFESQFLAYMPSQSNFSNLFLFPTSAAECLEYAHGEWKPVYDFLFSNDEKDKIRGAFKIAIEESGVFNGDEQIFGEQLEDRGEQMTFSALGQKAPIEIKKEWDPSHEKREKVKEILDKLIPEFEVKIGGTTSIDVTRKGIAKDDGILWLSQKFNVDPKEMLYVGDALYEGGNDSEVLKTGIQAKQVSGPEETLAVINEILSS